MKSLLPFLCILSILLVVACAPSGNRQSSTPDSTTAVADTVVGVMEVVAEDTADDIKEDINMLEERFANWKKSIDDRKDSLYEVSISTRQYESGSSVTWYFDSNIKPIYFFMNWSAEGNEGSTEHIIHEGHVVCAFTGENSVYERWCQSIGGMRTDTDEETGEETKTVLDEEMFFTEQEMRLQEHLDILSSLLKQATMIGEEGDWMILRREEVVNYGVEFTESAEVRIHKEVYKVLK